MFNRYTEIAKQTIFFAKNEAAQLGSREICPEHILLALLRDQDVTSQLMKGVAVLQVREDILAHVMRQPELHAPVDLPLNRQSEELLTLAEQEADGLSHRQVWNWHILLGLLRVKESYAAQLLESKGLSTDSVRARIKEMPVIEGIHGITIDEMTSPSTAQESPENVSSVIRETIAHFRDLLSRGEQRTAMKLVDEVMAESVPERRMRIRQLAPLATAAARSIGDFRLVKHYCEMRLANDPDDVTALYGMAECLAEQGVLDEARSYITKCYELSAGRKDAFGKKLVEMLKQRFPEPKAGS